LPNLLHQPIGAISAQLADGKFKAQELIEAAQARHDPKLNGYVTWAPDFARQQAGAADAAFASGNRLGALQGIPFSVKDLYGVGSLPTFAGSPRALPLEWPREGWLFRRFRD